MQTIAVRSIGDTIASELRPSTNYTGRDQLLVRNVSGKRVHSYVDFRGLVTDESAIVTKATLRLTPISSFASTTFQVRRQLEKWTPSEILWTHKPSDGPVSVTKTAAGTVRQPFDIEITNVLSSWLTEATPNFGIRLDTTSTAASGRSFHSANATGTAAPYRPVLLLEVTYAPDAPTALNPSGGGRVSVANPVATWRYGGAGATPMAAYQVQTSLTGGGFTSANGFASPTTDTGELPATESDHEFGGLSGVVFWTVRHKSSDGRWSAWADPESFAVAAKGIVTITSTAAVVDDPSPTTTWTFTGTQVSYQVILRRADTKQVVADSRLQVGSANQWAPAKPIAVPPGVGVLREVRVWDDVDRVATTGEPVYAVATSGPFTIVPSGAVANAIGTTATTGLEPAVDVSWTRSSTPDSYIVERRKRRYPLAPWGPWARFEVESGDVALGGNSYVWRDLTAPPEHDLSYRVRAVVNGAMSEAPEETEAINVRPSLIWLADPDDPDWFLPIAGNDAGTWALGEDSSVVNVLGSDRTNITHEGFRGYEGSIAGTFHSRISAAGDVSAQEQRERFFDLKRKPTHVWRLILSDLNIPVVVRNAQVVPRPGGEVSFGVSLDFYQQGSLPWEDEV